MKQIIYNIILETSGIVTISSIYDRIRNVPYTTAGDIIRSVMWEMCRVGEAKYIKRGMWEVLDKLPESTEADKAADKLRAEGFTEERALAIAEEFGVSIKALVVAMKKPRKRIPIADPPAYVPHSDAYEFTKFPNP